MHTTIAHDQRIFDFPLSESPKTIKIVQVDSSRSLVQVQGLETPRRTIIKMLNCNTRNYNTDFDEGTARENTAKL